MSGCQRVLHPRPTPEASTDAATCNWRGIAHLERYDYRGAASEFRAALNAEPDNEAALTNLGLACYYLGGPALAEARRVLTKARGLDANNATALYVSALVELQTGDRQAAQRAASCLERLADLAVDDDLVQTQLGMAYERLDKHVLARKAFERSLALNPNNATAHWRLGQLLLVAGERERALEHLKTHEGLSHRPEAVALGKKYGEVGRLGQALRGDPPATETLPFETRFVEVTKDTELAALDAGASAVAWLDVEADGDQDLLVALTAERGSMRLYLNDGKGGLRPSAAGLPDVPGKPAAVAVGDIDRRVPARSSPTAAKPGVLPPSYPEVFVCADEASALWVNGGDGEFEPRPPAGGGQWPACVDAAFVDYDHDGDLDLLCVRRFDDIALYQNAGGRFEDLTSSAGLAGIRGTSVTCLDLDRDRAIDFVLGGDARFLRNNWDGTFSDVSVDWGMRDLGGVSQIVPGDVSADGVPELLLLPAQWRPPLCSVAGPGELSFTELPAVAGPKKAATWGDFDNDGLTDLFLATAPHVGSNLETEERVPPDRCLLLRNVGGSYVDVSEEAGLSALELIGAVGVAPCDFDGDGDLDVAVATGQGVRLLRNDTPASRHWLQVSLTGLHSNRNGIGAKVELFCKDGQACHYVTSAPELSSPLHFGLGTSTSADWLRVTWPSGIVQSEIDVAADRALAIRELDRKPTSCPVLYAHDGSRFRFLTDCLGNAIIGYLLARGEYCPWDPDEYVRIPGDRVGSQDGRYQFELADQLEEVLFIDEIRLLAVDHPEGTYVYSSDLMRCGPPYPEFELYGLERIQAVRAATSTAGQDVSGLVAHADRDYLEDFAMHPELDGYASPHELVLDLGDLAGATRVWLLVEGYLEYAHSSSNLAASQCGVTCQPPVLDVGDGKGGWRTVREDAGLVAGLTKEIAIELTPALLLDDPRARIRTDMPFFVDRVRVGVTTREVALEVHEARGPLAEYHWLGYPEPTHPKGKEPVAYDYASRRDHAPWQTPLGHYTRTGDVSELLSAADDRYVIMRHGYAIRAAFDEIPAPGGMTRTFFLYVNGVGKDMDMNGAFANTVEPLPCSDMAAYSLGAQIAFPWTPRIAKSMLEHQTLDQAGPSAAPTVTSRP